MHKPHTYAKQSKTLSNLNSLIHFLKYPDFVSLAKTYKTTSFKFVHVQIFHSSTQRRTKLFYE